MKIRVIQEVENDDYIFTFKLENVGTDDIERISKFGEPQIDVGGEFGSGETAYTLSSSYRNIPSDFPVRRVFTSSAPFDTDTESKLATYRSTIVTRITDAITELRSTSDTFTGEYITTI